MGVGVGDAVAVGVGVKLGIGMGVLVGAEVLVGERVAVGGGGVEQAWAKISIVAIARNWRGFMGTPLQVESGYLRQFPGSNKPRKGAYWNGTAKGTVAGSVYGVC